MVQQKKIFYGANYLSAGKTGTAQVFSLRGSRYNARGLHKKLHDHALYMGFAPVNNPKIAVALIVENGGWGAKVAAPMARKVFDYWLSPNRQEVPDYVPAFLEEDEPNDETSSDVEVPSETPSNPEDKTQDALPDILDNIPSGVDRQNPQPDSKEQTTSQG